MNTATYFAIVNIILVAVAIAQAIIFVIRYAQSRRNKEQGTKNARLAAVMGIIAAAALAIVFILTEDLSGAMRLTDDLTITMTMIVGASSVLGFAGEASAADSGIASAAVTDPVTRPACERLKNF